SRHRPAHRRRRAGARLSDHTGGDPAVLPRLRADQSRRRSRLPRVRSEDPLLSVEPALIAEAAAPAPVRPGMVAGLAREWGVVAGAAIILFMILIGLGAPLLGTVDPA